MSNLSKLEFNALEVSGRNYLRWAQDVKLHLTAKKLHLTIAEGQETGDGDQANAMIFIRKHMPEALQIEYLGEENPLALWKALAERYDHQQMIHLPEARHDWQNLRFQDFKSVNEYNSEVCRIRSVLKYCKEDKTDDDLLEKTFSTFHPSNVLLQQQYRERKFQKFSDLITTLLLAEKNNNLLMKNHHSRPTGSKALPLPEANASSSQNHQQWNKRRGKGDKPTSANNGSRNQGQRGNHGPNRKARRALAPKGSNFKNSGKAESSRNSKLPNMCYRCGSTEHWSRTCRAPTDVVNEYHSRRQPKETNFAQTDDLMDTHLETSDFQEPGVDMEE